MTPRQRALLDFIAAYQAQHRFSPSFDEMAAAIGVKSKSNIHTMITQLKAQRRLTSVPGSHRSVEIVTSRDLPPLSHPSPKPVLSHIATETLVAELTQRGVFSL